MERRLTPTERLANRLGYMGTGFFVTAPHMLPDTPGVVIYFLAGLFCTPQVWGSKAMELSNSKLKCNDSVRATIF